MHPPIPRKTHLVRTFFSGIWSSLKPKPRSKPIPEPRTGHLWAYWENRNSLVIGFGVGKDKDLYNDVWIFDIEKQQWVELKLKGVFSPRVEGRATVVGNRMFVFGGSRDGVYNNEMFTVDLESGVCTECETTGSIPSPRIGCMLVGTESNLFVWGGYDNSYPSDLHVLDLTSMVWESVRQDVVGRTGVAYVKVGDYVYGYGGAETGGLLVLDIKERKLSIQSTSGPEPPPKTTNASMIAFGGYLLYLGGTGENTWTLLYAIDLSSYRWFVFHVVPDGYTVSASNGSITDTGRFMIPRMTSASVVYDKKQKNVMAFLGCTLGQNTFVLSVGQALADLNLAKDMISLV